MRQNYLSMMPLSVSQVVAICYKSSGHQLDGRNFNSTVNGIKLVDIVIKLAILSKLVNFMKIYDIIGVSWMPTTFVIRYFSFR